MNKLTDIFLRFLGGELSRSSPVWVAGTVGSVVPTRISPCAGAHVRGRPARMRRCRCRVRGVRTSFFLLGINRLRASCLNAFCESTEKAQTGALSQNPSIGIPLGVTLCGGIHKPPSISLYSEARRRISGWSTRSAGAVVVVLAIVLLVVPWYSSTRVPGYHHRGCDFFLY